MPVSVRRRWLRRRRRSQRELWGFRSRRLRRVRGRSSRNRHRGKHRQSRQSRCSFRLASVDRDHEPDRSRSYFELPGYDWGYGQVRLGYRGAV